MTRAKAYQFDRAEHWRGGGAMPLATKVQIDAAVSAGPDDPPLADARLLAVAGQDEALFIDRVGRLRCGDSAYAGFTTPKRLIIDWDRIWVLDECEGARALFLVDRRSLHILERTDEPELIDAAPDGKGGLWLLTDQAVLRRGRCDAEARQVILLSEPARAIAAAGECVAVLDGAGSHLSVSAPITNAVRRIDLAQYDSALLTGAGVTIAGSPEAFLVSWTEDGTAEGPIGGYLTFDPNGELLAIGRFDTAARPFTLVMNGRDIVFLVARDSGVALGRAAGAVRPGGERRLLPTLELSRPGSNWHRADIVAALPPDATLSLRWAASEDKSLRLLVDTALADAARPISQRLATIDSLLGPLWSSPIVYPGSMAAPGQETFALPFYGARASFLWVDIQLLSPAGEAVPNLARVRVLHDTEGLLRHLPAIYRDDSDLRQGRRTAFDGSTRPLVDDTMRRLVAVLESTIDGIDQSIAGLAQRLDPSTTNVPWLADLASMLGLPFHEALDEQMRRRLLGAAGDILARRGTRAGLLALLQAVFPDRSIRVRDRTEDLIPVTLGGGGIEGSRLPRLLTGPSIHVPRLNARLVLSRTALCPLSACDDPLIAPMPQVLVEIPATVSERRRYRTAIGEMIEEMVPAGVRPVVRWVPFGGPGQTASGHALTTLPTDEPTTLDGGQPLGGSPLAGSSNIGRPIGDAGSIPHRLA